MKTFIGIDIGTSATRAVMIDVQGAQIGTASRQHAVSEPAPGYAEHDAEVNWWQETCETLRELATRFPPETGRLAAIGLSAVGASIVPVDRDGRALRPAILYGIDRRALDQMARLEQRLGADEALRRTGRDFSTQSVGPKILWIEENEPEIAARVARYLPPTAFIAQRLGAEAAIDLHTALAIHPLFRSDRMEWDQEAIAHVCRPGQLPTVTRAGAPIGRLSPEAAGATGLPVGVPICCGTADVLADGLASGATRPGDTMVMYGSTLFVAHVTDTFQPRPPFWASVYPTGAHHCLVTGTSTAGAAADWYLGLAGCRSASDKDAMLAAVANVRAAEEGLYFLPYLRGERAPIFMPSARGAFIGLTTHHTSVHLYRAVLEGIGFSLRHVLDEMPLTSKRVLASGGGSDLALPLQIAVDAAGVSQLKARRGRSAGYGAAVLAAIGSKAIALETLSDEFFGGFDTIEPRQDAASAEEFYGLYRKISAAAAELYRESIYMRASGSDGRNRT